MKDISKLIQEEIPKAFADGRLEKNSSFSISKLADVLNISLHNLKQNIKRDFGGDNEFYNFLGFGIRYKVDFQRAREICFKLKIKSSTEFYNNRDKLSALGVPSNPARSYKNEWKGWNHLFGTKSHLNKKFPSYYEGQRLCLKYGINSKNSYEEIRIKLKLNLPSCPYVVYKDNWKGWDEFLGKLKSRNVEWPTLKEAQRLVKKHNINSIADYEKRVSEIRPRLPRSPLKVYGGKWSVFLMKCDCRG